MKANFAEKNDNRRRCRNADPERYHDGRAARKALARGGAFGHAKTRIYVRCVLGTTGVQVRDLPDAEDAA